MQLFSKIYMKINLKLKSSNFVHSLSHPLYMTLTLTFYAQFGPSFQVYKEIKIYSYTLTPLEPKMYFRPPSKYTHRQTHRCQ